MQPMNEACKMYPVNPSRAGIFWPVLFLAVLLVSGGIFAYNHFQDDRAEFELRRAHRALSLQHTQTLEDFGLALGAQKTIQVEIEGEIALEEAARENDQERLAFLRRNREESIHNQKALDAGYRKMLTRIEADLTQVSQQFVELGFDAL